MDQNSGTVNPSRKRKIDRTKQKGRAGQRQEAGATPPSKNKKARSEKDNNPKSPHSHTPVNSFINAASNLVSNICQKSPTSPKAKKSRSNENQKSKDKKERKASRSPAHKVKSGDHQDKKATGTQRESSGKTKKLEGKDSPSMPPGAKPSDFERPEGAGTEFVLDHGPQTSTSQDKVKKAASSTEQKKVDAMEISGGQNYSTLPPGTTTSDFAQPTEAGTGFSMVDTNNAEGADKSNKSNKSNKEQKPQKVNAMEVEGGKNLASLPPGAKPEDFQQPTEAGTGFSLDMGPSNPTPQSPLVCTTAYEASPGGKRDDKRPEEDVTAYTSGKGGP